MIFGEINIGRARVEMLKYFKDIEEVYKYKTIIRISILISFIVVFLDMCNMFTKLINLNCIWLLGLGVAFFIIKIISKNSLLMFVSKSVNYLDVILNSAFISLITICCYTIFSCNEEYKIILVLMFSLITICLIISRIIFINKKKNEKDINVYDLKYLCENKVNITSDEIVLLEEQEVVYDLLDRNSVINQIFNTIIKCKPERAFTIGINGPWGSGKTTVMNNVVELIKKNKIEDSFVIIKFDPWEYDNEKALLKGLIDEILNKTKLDLKIEDMDKLINSFIDIVFYNTKPPISNFFKLEKTNIENKLKIENIINNYLINQNKKMILVIDNMDRIDPEKVKFLLKCVSTVLNYKNTINILLYDENIIEKELNDIFKINESNKKYMEKIVQLKIDIPPVDESDIDKIKNKIWNNLTIEDQSIPKQLLSNEIKFKNIRELKRFLNYIFSSVGNMPSFLNTTDFINLDFIKSKNPELYYNIWEKKTYYISDDRQYDSYLYTLDYEKQNQYAKDYFDKLFSEAKNREFLDVLVKLFPNVNKWNNEQKIFDSNYRNKEQYQSGIKENRIYNTRYFDLYFTKKSNDFIRINDNVYSLIDLINEEKNEKKIEKQLEKIISLFSTQELKVFMEVLEINMEKIYKEKYLIMATILYKNVNLLSSIPIFFGVDSKERCEVIIAKLLNKMTINEVRLFSKKIFNTNKNIYVINQILNYMEGYEKNEENIKELRDNYNLKCQSIIDNQVDLYLDSNYSYGNVWGIYHYDKERTVEYISNIINEENIYRFLNDIISHSIGTRGYGYSIGKANINALAPNININELIDKHNKSLTKDEKFIKEIYDLYNKKNSDNSYEEDIYLEEYKIIKDI